MGNYYYVKSPFSGNQRGQDCYCVLCSNLNNTCNGGSSCCADYGRCTSCGNSTGGCKHNTGITGLAKPVDISGAANTAVKCYVNSLVKSIKTIRTGPKPPGRGGCPGDSTNNNDALCSTAPPSTFCWVDEGVKVELYCELNACGYIGTVFYGHLRNRIANGTYNWPNGKIIGYLGNQNCACACYSGIHLHMERSTINGGYTYYRQCGTSVTTSSNIYRFYLDYCFL